MRLLLIEDDKGTASFVQKGFREAGFVVDVAHDGLSGLHLATTGSYDVVVLDVMMPKMDGFTALARMRAHPVDACILMLTAKDSVHDRVQGLENGADDYLIKPFAFSELLARVRNLLRRKTDREEPMLQIDNLIIDLKAVKVTRNGQKINLTAKEFTLLALLARHQGEMLSRAYILEQVWEFDFDPGTNVVEVAIKRLRSKIDKDFITPLIHTVRGMGYILEVRCGNN